MPPDRLDPVEARVLGCLVEKSLTTPELYPLSLNALVNACNQKSSREPVMSLDHPAVQLGVNSLVEKGYAARRYEPGGRAEKFGHRVDVLLSSEDPKTIGAVCVLLLRGPQTVGEIKTRSERLCQFANPAEVDALLQQLAARPDGPIVERLPRQTGQKEVRWRELFTVVPSAPTVSSTVPGPAGAGPGTAPKAPDRLTKLENRVQVLEKAVEELRGSQRRA